MRRVDVESGFNPRAIGDDGTSFGLYQHHGPRAVELANWAQNHGLNPADPVTQTKFAIAEMNGGDPIAAQSKPALMKATDSRQAYGAFTSGFERPAGAPGSEETNLYRAAQGSFNGPAAAILSQWQSGMAQRGAEYDAALTDAKDLHSASRAALAQWEAESNRPPQNMHAAWSQWAGLAGAIALFGGLFGRRSMTASLTAAGSMLQAANQADVQTYDKSYQQWKDHLDRGLKVIDLVNGEARDIVDDARKGYDQQVSELQTMSAAYQLEKRLDPESVENLTKNLQLLKDRRELIVAQNTDTELRNAATAKDAAWLKDHPEAGGAVPAEIHNANVGAAKHDRSGIRAQTPQEAAFQQFIAEHPNATSEEMQSFFRSMHAPRSGIGMAMRQFIAEHPGASSQEISRFYANLQQEVGAGRAFAYGKQGDAIRSFSVALTHLDTIEKLGDALENGDVQRLNRLANTLQTEFGATAVPNFEFAKQIVGAEVTKAIVGGAGSVTDRQELQGSFNAANSPAQLVGVIKTAKALMAGQLSGYRRQYENATGLQNFDELLSPEARQELGKSDASHNAALHRDKFQWDGDPFGRRNALVHPRWFALWPIIP